ncbi:MAG: DUF4153 domain-containing protein, partial [Candidatus Eisenbacteria bacterium]|nr:DUF4153 domain-containing protein [Candidatus Eisenbacteria bacterium]
MRFFSLDDIAKNALDAFRRHPFVILSGIVCAVIINVLISSGNDQEEVLIRMLMSAVLGLPLFVAIDTFANRAAEKSSGSSRQHLWLRLAGLAFLVVVFFFWSRWQNEVVWRRFVQLALAFHLAAAFTGYLRSQEHNGFWQFNRNLLLRFMTAVFFGGVLFAGISVAFVALDQLFGANIDGEFYLRLFAVIGFVFITWYFASGIPDDFEALEEDTSYPLGVKIFSQFILQPIVILYLLILTAYLVKVLFTQKWPSGWIGYLVSSVSVVGMLSLLLLYPIQHFRENRWVKTYGRLFYIALLPSIFMLFLAIGKRVGQYGVTENRYFLLVLTVWLSGIAVYFIFSKSKAIRVIPISLCLLSLLTSFGPWGAYAVSKRSQVHRLQSILERNELFAAGQVVPAEEDVPLEDRREISATFRYILNTHGYHPVDDWFPGGATAIDTTLKTWKWGRGSGDSHAQKLMAHMNVPYINKWEHRQGQVHQNYFYGQGMHVVPVKGFDYLCPLIANGRFLEAQNLSITTEFHRGTDPTLVIRNADTDEMTVDLAEVLRIIERVQADGVANQKLEAPIEIEAESSW